MFQWKEQTTQQYMGHLEESIKELTEGVHYPITCAHWYKLGIANFFGLNVCVPSPCMLKI